MPSEIVELVLNCCGVSKTYRDGNRSVDVLSNVNLELRPGERLAVIGSSGAGKSTLLNILSGLDAPTSGSVALLGTSTERLPSR